jgi:hypothetical protein
VTAGARDSTVVRQPSTPAGPRYAGGQATDDTWSRGKGRRRYRELGQGACDGSSGQALLRPPSRASPSLDLAPFMPQLTTAAPADSNGVAANPHVVPLRPPRPRTLLGSWSPPLRGSASPDGNRHRTHCRRPPIGLRWGRPAERDGKGLE